MIYVDLCECNCGCRFEMEIVRSNRDDREYRSTEARRRRGLAWIEALSQLRSSSDCRQSHRCARSFSLPLQLELHAPSLPFPFPFPTAVHSHYQKDPSEAHTHSERGTAGKGGIARMPKSQRGRHGHTDRGRPRTTWVCLCRMELVSSFGLSLYEGMECSGKVSRQMA